jgi:PAS domain-containing protein
MDAGKERRTMTTMVAHSHLAVQPRTLSAEELAGLARTFDDAPQAVWVHDLAGHCVYHNRAASQTAPSDALDVLSDILDHQNRRIAHLRLRID